MVPLEVVGVLIDKFVDAVNRHVEGAQARSGILSVLQSIDSMPGPRAVH